MQLIRTGVVLGALGLLVWLFGFGGMADLGRWANGGQEQAQRAMASALRAVRAGEPGAIMGLMGLCAAYGFFHAAGPGHGKLVIGGYGAARRVTAWRLSGLAVVSSLAQALAAVVLVAAGSFVLGWSRAEMTDTADAVLAPASYIAIALVGVWLLMRGARKLWRQRQQRAAHHDHEHHHHHDDGHTCAECGHAHGPSIAQVEDIRSWRDTLAIVGSIAIRPCTGAVFLLILCFALGIPWAGVAGAMVMGLGTASVTVLVAIAAVNARESVMTQLSGTGALRAMAMIEIVAGALVALVATALVLPLL